MKPFLFYLIGFSGTGKFTIGSKLAELASAVLIDNQLINQPVFAAMQVDGEKILPLGVWREIRKVREAVYNTLSYLADKETSFILTNELFEESSDAHIYKEVESVAATRNSIFVPVRLICERDELLKRVVNEGRSAKLKTRNTALLQDKLDAYTVLKPSHKNLFELDVTHHAPEESALLIWNHAQEIEQKP